MGKTSTKLATDKPQLRRLVDSFAEKRVLVVGDLMLDQFIRGHVSRISPEAPVPVVRVGEETSLPGGAGNVAVNLASLGAHTTVLGVVGPDDAGKTLAGLLSKRGVAVAAIVEDHGRVTAQKCRVIAERQQVVRYDRETAAPLSEKTESRILDAIPRAVEETDAVILSDYGKGVIGPRVLKAAIQWARRLGKPITVDPKPEHFKLYRGVTCTTPNLMEAFGGMARPLVNEQGAIERLGRDIVKALKAESVLITRGPDGMSLFKADGEVMHVPTQAREVFDVTGAGDTVIATLTLALAAGARVDEAAVIANHAAGVVVGKLGTASCTPAELLRALG